MVTTDMSDDYERIPCDAGPIKDGWAKARIRHHLARRGLIRYQINGALGGTVMPGLRRQIRDFTAPRPPRNDPANDGSIQMTHLLENEPLTIEQSLGQFRARTVSELKLMNENLPRSLRLERREADRLVDDFVQALQNTLKKRNASLIDIAVWHAHDAFMWATHHRSRNDRFANNKAIRNRKLRS